MAFPAFIYHHVYIRDKCVKCSFNQNGWVNIFSIDSQDIFPVVKFSTVTGTFTWPTISNFFILYLYVMEQTLVCFSLNMHDREVKTVKIIKYEIITDGVELDTVALSLISSSGY